MAETKMIEVFNGSGATREFDEDTWKQMLYSGNTYGWQQKAVAPEEVEQLKLNAAQTGKPFMNPEQAVAQESELARKDQLALKGEVGTDSTDAARGKGLDAKAAEDRHFDYSGGYAKGGKDVADLANSDEEQITVDASKVAQTGLNPNLITNDPNGENFEGLKKGANATGTATDANAGTGTDAGAGTGANNSQPDYGIAKEDVAALNAADLSKRIYAAKSAEEVKFLTANGKTSKTADAASKEMLAQFKKK